MGGVLSVPDEPDYWQHTSFSSKPTEELLNILHDELNEKTETIRGLQGKQHDNLAEFNRQRPRKYDRQRQEGDRQRQGGDHRTRLCQLMSETEKKLFYFNTDMAGKLQVQHGIVNYEQMLRQKNEALREKNSHIQKENTTLNNLLQDMVKSNTSRSEEGPSKDAAAKRTNDLGRATYQRQSEEETMKAEMQKIKQNMLKLLQLKDDGNKKNEELEAHVHQLQKQEDEINKAKDIANKKNKDLEARVDRLQRKEAVVIELNINLTKQNEDMTEKIKQLRKEVEELEAYIGQEQKYPNENKDHNQAVIDALAKQLHLKNVIFEETEEKLQKQVDVLKKQNMIVERDATRLTEEIQQLQNQVVTLKAQNVPFEIQNKLKERNQKLRTYADRFAVLPRREEVEYSSDSCDLNQPRELVEVYEEIYRNEWADAFQQLLNAGYLEEKAVEALRLFLQDVVQFCENDIRPFIVQTSDGLQLMLEQYWTSGTFAKTLKASLPEDKEESAECFGMVSGRRKRAQDMKRKPEDKKSELGVLLAQYAEKEFQEATLGLDYIPALKPFIVKCLNLGWMMAFQSVPVVLHECHDDVDMMFDSNMYTAYKISGPLVKFVVWPALLHHKDGSVIAKGIAEGKQRRANNRPRQQYLQR